VTSDFSAFSGFEPALGPKETICPFKAFGRAPTGTTGGHEPQ